MTERLEQPGTVETAQSAAWTEADRARVLIVDDDHLSRGTYAGYCDLFDHLAATAAGGAEAVEALRREPFSVVVMNVHMEEDGGLETLRAIRALPGPASRTPVIGLTAPDGGGEAQRWLGAGLADVLAKPITAARLYAALNSVTRSPAEDIRSWAPR
jgi:two-component system, sensor histidine kinase